MELLENSIAPSEAVFKQQSNSHNLKHQVKHAVGS